LPARIPQVDLERQGGSDGADVPDARRRGIKIGCGDAPIFRLDSSSQEAAAEAARRKIAEVEAAMVAARTDVMAAKGKIQEARSAHQQAVDELETKQELNRRNAAIVAAREIERLQNLVNGRQGAVAAATAAKDAAEVQISTLLPAQKASAEAALAKDEVDLAKTFIRAGVNGRVEQFTLRVGDIVNPIDASSRNPDPGGGRTKNHYGGLPRSPRR
jgi:multidrug resistance efflux pump